MEVEDFMPALQFCVDDSGTELSIQRKFYKDETKRTEHKPSKCLAQKVRHCWSSKMSS